MTPPPTTAIQPLLPSNAIPKNGLTQLIAAPNFSLPECLESIRGLRRAGSHKVKKKRSVISILEWIQCFTIYTTVISRKQPERVPDLLGYQSLLIDTYQEYRGDSWIEYDRRFHLSAAANGTKVWACINPTLWNLAFTGNAKTSRCTHCFSLIHTSSDCEWAPDPPTINCSAYSAAYKVKPTLDLLQVEQCSWLHL